MRWGTKPDGVCLVVGTCGSGFAPGNNTTADVILTNTPLQPAEAAFNRCVLGPPCPATSCPIPSAQHAHNMWPHFVRVITPTPVSLRDWFRANPRLLLPLLSPPFLSRAQYFWEAFPAASGPSDRTTYMFTYIDAAPYRKPLAAMMVRAWVARVRWLHLL